MKKIILALVLFAILAFVAGCAPAAVVQSSSPEAAESATIEISGFAFVPDVATIKRGGEVTWINRDNAAHTVVFDDEQSPQLEKGDSWAKTFSKTGEERYSCGIHPSMTGRIIVK
jgi:plastocyanin